MSKRVSVLAMLAFFALAVSLLVTAQPAKCAGDDCVESRFFLPAVYKGYEVPPPLPADGWEWLNSLVFDLHVNHCEPGYPWWEQNGHRCGGAFEWLNLEDREWYVAWGRDTEINGIVYPGDNVLWHDGPGLWSIQYACWSTGKDALGLYPEYVSRWMYCRYGYPLGVVKSAGGLTPWTPTPVSTLMPTCGPSPTPTFTPTPDPSDCPLDPGAWLDSQNFNTPNCDPFSYIWWAEQGWLTGTQVINLPMVAGEKALASGWWVAGFDHPLVVAEATSTTTWTVEVVDGSLRWGADECGFFEEYYQRVLRCFWPEYSWPIIKVTP